MTTFFNKKGVFYEETHTDIYNDLERGYTSDGKATIFRRREDNRN